MQRLFTAFVSSTSQDLEAERQRLVRVLLDQHCVPLGMEFFPSAGRTAWSVIVDEIAAADFCLFVIAGRYGSVDEHGMSWTHREFHEAVRQRKPVAAFLHAEPHRLPADKVDFAPEAVRSLEAFRAEVGQATITRTFRDEADLVQAVASSVSALRDDDRVEGWVRAGPNPVVLQESDFDRVYEVVDTTWTYVASQEVAGTWDGRYRGRREMVAQDPHGVPRVAADFTRDTDAQLPFEAARFPRLELADVHRELAGDVSLLPPRKRTGSTFVQDVQFSPPLSRGEAAKFTVQGVLPAYKYGFREDLLNATTDSRLGPRMYDWTSRRVTFPTRRLRMTVYLPLALGARPRGPLIGRGSGWTDPELSATAVREGAYTHDEVEHEGERCHKLTLSIENPRLRWYYRVAWDLPARAELAG